MRWLASTKLTAPSAVATVVGPGLDGFKYTRGTAAKPPLAAKMVTAVSTPTQPKAGTIGGVARARFAWLTTFSPFFSTAGQLVVSLSCTS